MDEIKKGAREFRARENKKSRLFDSLALVFLTLLALWLTFDQML